MEILVDFQLTEFPHTFIMALNLNNILIFLLIMHWLLDNGMKISKVNLLLDSEIPVISILFIYYIYGVAPTTITSNYTSNLSITSIQYLLFYEFTTLKYFF